MYFVWTQFKKKKKKDSILHCVLSLLQLLLRLNLKLVWLHLRPSLPHSQLLQWVTDSYFILSWQILITNTQYIPQLNKLVICHLSVRVMVQCPWRLVNKWEWPQRSFRRYYFFFLIFHGLDTSFFSYAIPDSFPPSILVSAWLFFCLQLQAKATILTTERKKVLFCLLNFPHYVYYDRTPSEFF